MRNLLIVFSICALAACGQNAPTNQTAKPAATIVSANSAVNNSVSALPTENKSAQTEKANSAPGNSSNAAPPADKSKIKLFDGKGVVTQINLELSWVELDHEAIEGLMPKMTMMFTVKEKSELEKLKVGDRVDFVLEDDAGAERIVKITKSK